MACCAMAWHDVPFCDLSLHTVHNQYHAVAWLCLMDCGIASCAISCHVIAIALGLVCCRVSQRAVLFYGFAWPCRSLTCCGMSGLGMLCRSVAWCVVVWCGMLCHGLTCSGLAKNDVHGLAWYTMAFCGLAVVFYAMLWLGRAILLLGVVWLVEPCYAMAWQHVMPCRGIQWLGVECWYVVHVLVCCAVLCYTLAWHTVLCCGLAYYVVLWLGRAVLLLGMACCGVLCWRAVP